jgi:xylose dehydrogenase (NAD/NADP)
MSEPRDRFPATGDRERPVRWGLLGTGHITRKLLAGAAATSTADVVAVGSRDGDRATAFAATNDIARAHDSYEALLADPEVDAVYISLPNSLHHPWTMHALAAGKHVLCEKPYSRRASEVDEAFDAADAAGLVLSEAFMWRHHPQVGVLRSIVSELGPLDLIRATFSFVLDDAADVRLRADLDGGSLMDVGCYCISGARTLAGEEPSEVLGIADLDETGVDRRFTGILRFPNGPVAEFSSGFTSNHRGLEAIGRDGSVLATDPWQSSPATIWRDGVQTILEPADPYTLELEDMAAAIRGERPALLGRADALGQARAIEALYRSAETGRIVPL